MLVNLVGRTGEPQRGADQPADAAAVNGTAIPRMPASTMQRADGTGAGHHPGGELRGQPGQGRRGGEGERSQRADHEAVHGLSRRRPQQAHAPARVPTSGACSPRGCRVPLARFGSQRSPAPSGTPYERATSAPVSSTQPTPSPIPNVVVRSSVRRGISRKTLVSRMYSRNNSGRPSDATEINAAGIRNVANVTSASNTHEKRQLERSSGPVWQLGKKRTGQRRPQEVLTRIGTVRPKS